MPKPDYKKVPLTPDESEWLMKIYKLRHDDLFYSGAFRCFAYSFIISSIVTNILSFATYAFWNGTGTLVFSSLPVNLFINILLALGITVSACAFISNYMIDAYKQDASCGMKFEVPLTIVSKEYFPVTGQYFFRLQNNPEKLYEVDQADYNKYEEGGTISMNQGINSGHIFGQNDEVRIKFFKLNRRTYNNY